MHEFYHKKTAIILIHEIYGINDHMKSTINHFERVGFDVYCPNLLNTAISFDYLSEKKAYKYFMDQVGFDRALQQVITMARELKVQKFYENIFVLGFSVGATVAWLCSNYGQLISGVIGFYGSRIRDYLDLTPKCKSLLFFPTIEKSFDPKEIIEVLTKKDNIQAISIKGKHGFTDQNSNYFDSAARDFCFNMTCDFIMNNSNLQ